VIGHSWYCWNWNNSDETATAGRVDAPAIVGTASNLFGIVYRFGNGMLLVGVWTLTTTIQLLVLVAC
jgi:hypothetical protein